MKEWDRKAYITEEEFTVQHSGEIPEITLHSSLYYLAEDPEGPGLELEADEIFFLKQAVIKRYREIILRDLEPENRDKSIYRGLARCAVNWQRLLKFCSREHFNFAALQAETAEALQKFLQQELVDVQSKKRSSSVNCPQEEVSNLAVSLGILPAELPDGWQELCMEKE
jgi:hypothetical protein